MPSVSLAVRCGDCPRSFDQSPQLPVRRDRFFIQRTAGRLGQLNRQPAQIGGLVVITLALGQIGELVQYSYQTAVGRLCVLEIEHGCQFMLDQ